MSLTLSSTYGAEKTEEATSKDSLEIAPRRDMREVPAYFIFLSFVGKQKKEGTKSVNFQPLVSVERRGAVSINSVPAPREF